MQSDIDVSKIIHMQQDRTALWHEIAPSCSAREFLGLMEQNHLSNFLLWHEEDVARRDDLGAERIRQAKRRIDQFNQQRNDVVEAMDQHLFKTLNPKLTGCPFNSETPGAMIDRLSILSLKKFHMREETLRTDASAEHRRICTQRLQTIRTQLQDLGAALSDLLLEIQAGTRSFRVYYQFKMYNDRTLNPELRRPDGQLQESALP